MDIARPRWAGATTSPSAPRTRCFLRSEETADGFDVIVCFEGLEHLPDPGAALAAFRELAERGMKLVVSVPNSNVLVYAANEERRSIHLR